MGIGQKKAEAIIEYRQKNGKFKTIEDIQQVKGIGPTLFAKNKDKLAL
ncbi:ComEA family DNA-binding protein [Escherichia coli]